jgi:hypothetical protein
MTQQELLDLKDQVDNAKNIVSELKGEQTALMKQLKEELKCKSLAEAKEILKTKYKVLEKLNSQIETGQEELEQKYGL